MNFFLTETELTKMLEDKVGKLGTIIDGTKEKFLVKRKDEYYQITRGEKINGSYEMSMIAMKEHNIDDLNIGLRQVYNCIQSFLNRDQIKIIEELSRNKIQ